MLQQIDGGDSVSDISIKDELFQKNRDARRGFEEYFRKTHTELQRIYKDMEASNTFKGKACEGFLEVFEILLKFHNDMMKEMPDFYKKIDHLEESLEEIPRTTYYRGLGE